MSAYTPGPWGLNNMGEVVTANGANLSIALIYPSSFLDGDQREANGRLIAAAPELVEALKRVALSGSWCVVCGGNADAHEEDCFVGAAITKALGQGAPI